MKSKKERKEKSKKIYVMFFFSSSPLPDLKGSTIMNFSTLNDTRIMKSLINNSKDNPIQNSWSWFICLKRIYMQPMKGKK